jgi:CubicO group peptidase (beta-lactamase class C family)
MGEGKNMRIRLALLLSLIAFSGQPGLAAEPDRASAIDKIVLDAGVTAESPGIAMAIVENGKVVFQKGYGLARLKDKTPIGTETTFEIASMTKMFTGTAVMLLADQGKLGFSDDIRKYVPELPEYDKEAPVLISNLLQHTSGLPDYLVFENVKGADPNYQTCADYAGQFAKRLKKHPAHFKPGEKYEYNNTNYMLLALIVERVSRQSFGQFLREHVLRPLGMNNSWVYESPASAPKAQAGKELNAIAYKLRKGEWQEGWGSPPFRHESLLTVGDGGLWTSIEDLARWDPAKLIKPATMQMALIPSKTNDGKTNPYGYGFGLSVNADNNLTSYWHDGSWVFRTSYHHDVKNGRTLILLSNRDDALVGKVRNGMMKRGR